MQLEVTKKKNCDASRIFCDSFCWSLKKLVEILGTYQSYQSINSYIIQTPYPNHAEKNKNKKAIKISYVRGNLQLKSFCFFPQIMSYQCHSHNIELWIELIPFIIITPSFFLSTRSTEPSIKSTVIIGCLSLKKKSNYQLTFFKFYIVILLCNITQNIKMYKETVSVQTTAKTKPSICLNTCSNLKFLTSAVVSNIILTTVVSDIGISL